MKKMKETAPKDPTPRNKYRKWAKSKGPKKAKAIMKQKLWAHNYEVAKKILHSRKLSIQK